MTTLTSAAAPDTSRRPSYYKKRLEGIRATAVLLDLWKYAYSQNASSDSSTKAATPEETPPRLPAPASRAEAIEVLRRAGDPSQLSLSTTTVVIPIRVLQSIRLLAPLSEISLDGALDSGTALAFTPFAEPDLTPERQKHLERMERLRLKSEETKYTRITRNIKDQRQEDDKTARSMTYAASVGINMIVAPVSFGAFMYFFSGGIFDYLFPKDDDTDYVPGHHKNPTQVDIKRLIVGVVSGVVMLVIEMVLFVIRSHEFDAHTTKKKQKRGPQPFGSYSSKSAMTYTDHSGSKATKNIKTPLAGEALETKKRN